MSFATNRHFNFRRVTSRFIGLPILAAAFVLLPAVALADSSSAYTFSGTIGASGTFSGNVDFSTSTSTGLTSIVGSNFTVDGIQFNCNGATSNNCLVFSFAGLDYFQALSGNSLVLFRWVPFPWTNAPATFSIVGGYCMNCIPGATVQINNGTAMATPEPGSALLLFAGLIALGFAASRRRFATNQI